MSVYAVERARQLVECAINLATTPLVQNCEAIEAVESWLGDAASRAAYRRELTFVPLMEVMGADFAVRHAGNLSPAMWQGAMAALAEGRANNTLPPLETGLPPDHPQVTYAQATTFIFNQYRYGDEVRVREGDVVLDCGACFGESALWALTEGAGKVWSFEPNPATFAFLERNARLYGAQNYPDGCFTPVPLALGREAATLAFAASADHPGASRLHPEGELTVPVTTLDAWCDAHGVIPDFVKMDLEGAEVDAIHGAARLFSTHAPRFAICLYHRLSDMWEIPHLLKRLCPRYTFWCKKSAPTAEFVLFGRAE